MPRFIITYGKINSNSILNIFFKNPYAFGHKCYIIWKDAEKDCQKHGAHLLSIDSQQEYDFVLKHVVTLFPTLVTHVYLGLSYQVICMAKWTTHVLHVW